MTWEIFATVLVAITGLITAIWAIIKFGIVRRDKMAEQKEQELQNIIVAPLERINERLDAIEIENKRQAEQIDSNERSRLREEIMAFSRELRAGQISMMPRDYEHIGHVFDKYTKLGGNSYVKAEMEYIHDCQRLQQGEQEIDE